MTRRIPMMLPAAALAVLGTAAAPAQAADVAAGKKLHAEHCVACHTSLMDGEPSRMYTREERKVDSRQALKSRVRQCELSLGLQWFDDDIADVAAYLNEQYYKF